MNENATRNLRNVMVLALIDGELADEEKQFIGSLREKLNIDEAEFRRLCDELRQSPRTMSLPRDPQEAEEVVELLVSVAAADGTVSEVERRVLDKLAVRAGIEPMAVDRMLAGQGAYGRGDQAKINACVTEVYENFAAWDASTRRAKVDALRSLGPEAPIALLKILESYRVPDGLENPLELKVLVAEQLGLLGDDRAAYYLAQQVCMADLDEEVSNAALRQAAAQALGKLVGQPFTPDQEGIEAGRKWWMTPEARRYDRLAL